MLRSHRRGPRLAQRSALRLEPLEQRQMLTITVNTLVDEADGSVLDGDVSLRDAINAASPGETINFSVQGTISLTMGFLWITDDLVIEGPGADLLTLDASPMDPTPTINNGDGNRIFYIDDQLRFTASEIVISGLTLTGGDSALAGGAIRSAESLDLIACVVTGNAAHDGGGLFAETNYYGQTRIIDSKFIDNEADDDGGGVWLTSPDGTDGEISGTEFSGNVAGDRGGAVFSSSSDSFGFPTTVTITGVQVFDNSATEGGGIYSTNSSADVLIRDTTVANNTADESGGGIMALQNSSSGGTVVVQSTISGNDANDSGGGLRTISQSTRPVEVRYSTVTQNLGNADNGVYGAGGGIAAAGPVVVHHSIVAENYDGDGSVYDARGTVNATYALIGDASTANVNDLGGNLLGSPGNEVDPLLGPLTLVGTQRIHPLQSGSPALNAGDSQLVGGVDDVPEFDQRGSGFERVSGGRIDLGSFERQIVLPDADFNDDGFYDCLDIDQLTADIAAGLDSSPFDLNGDGETNLVDRDLWLEHAGQANGLTGPYLPGDADLNGIVDGRDYVIWNISKFSVNDAWCAGDFDANGIVDGRDYVIWNIYKFTESDRRATSPVPPLANLSPTPRDSTMPVPLSPGPRSSGSPGRQTPVRYSQQTDERQSSDESWSPASWSWLTRDQGIFDR